MSNENKMGTMPVGKLLAGMSLPPAISMLVAATYNVVDGLFVARVSEDALTAVTLVFPVQMIMMAINAGIGVGLTSLISRRLGEKRTDEAAAAATHGFLFALLTWILYALFAAFLAEPFLRLFQTENTNPAVIEMALAYCRIIMFGSVFFNLSITIERILQSTGNMLYPMVFNLVGCVINIVMAPILIMGYFGVPALGVTGAALAALSGQSACCVIAIILFVSKTHAVHVRFRGFRPQAETMRNILAVGAPSIIMQAVNPILIGALNLLLMPYESAVFVLGVYFRISTFAILPIVGINQGALPIMGYNFGAKNRLRLMAAYKSAFRAGLIIMIVACAVFWIFPSQIMTLFSARGNALDMGVHALRTISISWVPGAFVIISISLFQALAHGVFALIVSIVRQIGFILPLAVVLLYYFGVNGTWYSYPLAEIAAFTLTFLFLRRVYKREVKKLPDGAPVAGK